MKTTIKLGQKELGHVVEGLSQRHKLSLQGFTGKSKNHCFYYIYNSQDELQKKIKSFSDNLIHWEKGKIKDREQRKIETKKFKNSLKKGTILTASWGYEQTNVEFYKVLSVKGFTVELVELSHIMLKNKGGSSMSANVMPDMKIEHGPLIKKRIASNSIKINSSISLRPWDGTSCYRSWYG